MSDPRVAGATFCAANVKGEGVDDVLLAQTDGVLADKS